MSLRADDGKTSGFYNALAQLDVRTTTSHVGSDGNRSGNTGCEYNLCFFLVQLGIQHIVLNILTLEHTAQQFRGFYGSCTYKGWSSDRYQVFYFFDYSIKLFPFGL